MPGLAPEAYGVFTGDTTGLLESHGWSVPHKEYNSAVGAMLDDFMRARSISPGAMTASEAQEFVSLVRGSTNPAVGGFLRGLVPRAGVAIGAAGFLMQLPDALQAAECERATGISRWAFLNNWWFGVPLPRPDIEWT